MRKGDWRQGGGRRRCSGSEAWSEGVPCVSCGDFANPLVRRSQQPGGVPIQGVARDSWGSHDRAGERFSVLAGLFETSEQWALEGTLREEPGSRARWPRGSQIRSRPREQQTARRAYRICHRHGIWGHIVAMRRAALLHLAYGVQVYRILRFFSRRVSGAAHTTSTHTPACFSQVPTTRQRSSQRATARARVHVGQRSPPHPPL